MSQPDTRPRSEISVFLSYSKPCMDTQQKFIDRVCCDLSSRGFAPRTLGVTDYDWDAPLKAIRRLMLESNGLITIAFRRTYIKQGSGNYRTNITNLKAYSLDDQWLTSPWAHIEPAMAYQVGLPILILREEGVIAEGLLEKGVTGTYMPVFNVNGSLDHYFTSPEWSDLISKWEEQVKSVAGRKYDHPQPC
jgi:hypothetical protein